MSGYQSQCKTFRPRHKGFIEEMNQELALAHGPLSKISEIKQKESCEAARKSGRCTCSLDVSVRASRVGGWEVQLKCPGEEA